MFVVPAIGLGGFDKFTAVSQSTIKTRRIAHIVDAEPEPGVCSCVPNIKHCVVPDIAKGAGFDVFGFF